MATKSTPEEIRAWAAAWGLYAEYAEQERRERLANFDHEANRDMIDSLLQIGARMVKPRPTSGLVEQQRLFAILREKWGGPGPKKNE